MKVGDKVRVWKVIGYYEPHGIRLESAEMTVEGLEDVPLVIAWKVSDKGRYVLGNHFSGSMQIHEAALSEDEAVRRWRAERLESLIEAENRVAEIRKELKRPIRIDRGEWPEKNLEKVPPIDPKLLEMIAKKREQESDDKLEAAARALRQRGPDDERKNIDLPKKP
jgi:hypothetical protein